MYKTLKVRELIEILKTSKQDYKIYIASDEEHNDIFIKFYISEDKENKAYILAGLSGTNLEQ